MLGPKLSATPGTENSENTQSPPLYTAHGQADLFSHSQILGKSTGQTCLLPSRQTALNGKEFQFRN